LRQLADAHASAEAAARELAGQVGTLSWFVVYRNPPAIVFFWLNTPPTLIHTESKCLHAYSLTQGGAGVEAPSSTTTTTAKPTAAPAAAPAAPAAAEGEGSGTGGGGAGKGAAAPPPTGETFTTDEAELLKEALGEQAEP